MIGQRAKIGDLTQFAKDRGITEAPVLSQEDACRLAAKIGDYEPKADDFHPPEVPYGYKPLPDEIFIFGDREFVNYNLARVKAMGAKGEILNYDPANIRICILDGPMPQPETAVPQIGTPVIGSDDFVRRISGLPEGHGTSDAEYRASLRDPEIPEGVKKAIRQYFAKREAEETTSKVKRFIPTQKNFVGRKVPFVSEAAYQKPKDMSARQFKKTKKSRFREFRTAHTLATKALATLKDSAAS